MKQDPRLQGRAPGFRGVGLGVTGKGQKGTRPGSREREGVTGKRKDRDKTGTRQGRDRDKIGTRQGRDRAETGTRQGQDRDKTGTR